MKKYTLKLTALIVYSMALSCVLFHSDYSAVEDIYARSVVSTSDSDTLSPSASITDPDAYDTNEIYVVYQDASSEVITCSDTQKLTLEIEQLLNDTTVAYFQPNYSYFQTKTISDPYFSDQWALFNDGTFVPQTGSSDSVPTGWPFMPVFPGRNPFRPFDDTISDLAVSKVVTYASTTAVSGIDMHVPDAWDVFHGGNRDTIISLIDTGVDYTHEDLADILWINSDEIANDGIDNDNNGYIDDVNGWNFYSNNHRIYVGSEDDHGTHGAGTIAANQNSTGIAGIVANSKISVMPLKALGGQSGCGTTQSIIEAIAYAEKNGAVICNLSLGTTDNDPALAAAIKASSMFFVAAAGNGGNSGNGYDIDASPVYPASYSYDNIISVANITYDGTLHFSSNYGISSVDIAAPGTSILSTTTSNTYSYMTGTSMSAPMISSVLAMIYSYYDDISISTARDILYTTVKPLTGLSSYVATGGIPDAYAALTYTEALTDSSTTKAPVISTKVTDIDGSYKKYLTVTVKDRNKTLVSLRYKKGEKDAAYFENGTLGTEFELDKNSKWTKKISSDGYYTIYALDSFGNETVKTVDIKIIQPTSIVFNKLSLSIAVKKSFTLKAYTDEPTIIQYTSSDTSVVKINKKTGKLTAQKAGTAVITATTENGLTTTCPVTVKK